MIDLDELERIARVVTQDPGQWRRAHIAAMARPRSTVLP